MKKNQHIPAKRLIVLFSILIASLLLMVTHLPVTEAQTSTTPEQRILQAWERAQQSGRYGFRSQVEQTTYPLPKITNAGAQPDVQHIGLEGQVDLPGEQMNLTLWQDVSFNPDTGIEIRVEDGLTYARQGQAEWQEVDNITDMFAPGGDPMAFLAGMQNVTVGESRSLEVAGTTVDGTQYLFDLDGPVLADQLRVMLEKQLQEQGKLPPGIRLSASEAYNRMVGSGELWIGENGLPLHSVFSLNFAAQGDEDERVTAVITNNFFGYDLARLGLATTPFFQSPTTWLAVHVPAESAIPVFAFGLLMVSAMLLIKSYWRTKTFYRFLASFIILSMLFSPLLQSEHVSAFYKEQQGKKETAEEQQAEADYREEVQAVQENVWQPNENAASQLKSEIPAARLANFQRSVGSDTDGDGIVDDEEIEYWETDPNNADSDGDGLDDGLEAYTLGTAPAVFDSDGDSLSDGLEVGGFTYNAIDWYLDPLDSDTNNDGLTDGAECNIWIANLIIYDPNAACPDTDGDGTPDLFDGDNDDDGVPDDLDISPLSHGGQVFSEDNKFELRLENLEVDQPVFVDLQIRPTDPNNISFVGAVLDWPTGDHDGQVTRYLDTTWADTAEPELRLDTDNAANGDVRVMPMLEIIIPGTNSHYGNLPVNDTYSDTDRPPGLSAEDWLDTELLAAYGIKAGDYGDSNQVFSDLIVYVPVSVRTDPDTGSGVSLNARIPYFPEQGTIGDPTIVEWGSSHEVRLIWLVQMLGDQCVLPDDDPATCDREDTLTTINIYDDEWNLTGMSATEELGVDMAIVYEDPALDTDLTLDDQLWLTSWNLNGSFLRGRDADMNDVRDVRVDNLEAEIAAWYDPASGPLYLEVEPFIDEFEYPDELHRVLMTDTLAILNTAFVGYETTTNPTFLFAKETTNRSMNLDGMTANGAEFTADFDPTIVLPMITADLSWKPYEYVGGQWDNADPVAYLETLDYHLAQSVFVETADMTQDDLDAVEGQRIWAQIYYSGLYQGLGNVVGADGEVVWLTSVEIDEDLYGPSWPASTFRGAGYIGQLYLMAFINAVKGTINSYPGKLIHTQNFWSDFRAGYRNASQKVFRSNFQSNTLNFVGHFVDLLLFLITIVAIIGLLYLISGLATGNEKHIKTGIMILNVVSLVIHFIHGVIIIAALIAFLYLINAAVQVAAHILVSLSEFLENSRAFGWIGFVASVIIAWGIFLYQWLSLGFNGNQIAKNLAIAGAISSTIIAIVFLILDVILVFVFGPAAVIFTLLLILLFIIDAILALAGEKTLTERLTEWIADTIYDVDYVLSDFNSEDRLSFDLRGIDLVNLDQGVTEGNSFYVTLDITNTITYRKSSNASEADRSAFAYYAQADETDRHQGLKGNSMSPDWAKIGNSQLRYTTTISNSAGALPFGSPGINVSPDFYLTEAYAIPYQGCWAFAGIESNTCTWEFIKGSSHIDLGAEILFDVLPSTISGFMDLQSWTAGQINDPDDLLPIYFPVQIDQDNDGLINDDLGGPDPDDTDVDTDDDGVTDLVEITNGTDPENPDTDGDQLTDGEEIDWFTDPLDFDTDDDGLSDYIEVIVGWLTPSGIGSNVMRVWSSPHFADIDGDNLSDLQEFTFGQHPAVPTDPNILSTIVGIDRLEVNEGESPLFLLQFEDAPMAEVFADSSSNGHTASCLIDTIHCPVSGSVGRYGYGADFTNDSVYMDASEFDFAADFSIGFWVKTLNANRNLAVLHNDNGGLDLPGEFVIEIEGGVAQLRQRLVAPTTGDIVGTTNIADNQWHHVMFVWDSVAETAAVYVDGLDDTNGPTGYENIVRDPSADSLSIGTFIFGPGINGKLDDFVMYDRVLTPIEINNVKNGILNPNDLILQPGDPFTYEGTITNTLPTQDVDGYLLGESQYLTPSIEAPAVVLPFNNDTYITTFANDITGESSALTCSEAQGCPDLGAAGRFGSSAVQFNNDSVNLPAISHGFETQTVAFWIRLNSYPAVGQTETILDTESDVLGALDITLDDSGRLIFDIGGSVTGYSSTCDDDGDCSVHTAGWQTAHLSDSALPINAWRHVMFTYRYTPMTQGSLQLNRSNIIIGGTYDSVATYSGIASPPTLTIGPGTLGNSVDGTQPIHARLDELVFYNGEVINNETNIDRIDEVVSGNYYPGLNWDVGVGTSWPAYLIKFEDNAASRDVGLVNQMTGGQAAFCTGDECPTTNGSGQFDQALNFDGSDDRLALNHVLNPADQSFTAMAWVRPDSTNGTVLQQEDGAGTGRVWLGLQGGNFLYSDLGGAALTSPQSLNNGQWYHTAVTYDGSTVRLYLDGQQVAQGTRAAESSNGDMLIGTNKAFGNFFNGLMDDMVIIPTVTDSDGIQSIMDHSHPAVNIDEPFVDFHIDEDVNVSTNYYDAISRYDDQYYLTTYADDLPVVPCTGAACPAVLDNSGDGASVLFDGVNDSLYLGELNFSSSEYAVGFWFRTSPAATNQTMFAATDIDSPYYPGVLVEVDTNGVVRYLHRGPLAGIGGTDLRGTTVVTDGEWHYVAITRERTEDFFTFNTTLFVDGAMEATLLDDDTFIGEITAVTIGRFPPATQDRYFNGEIDEMFISKSGIDANGVQGLMVRTLPDKEEGTVSGTGSISQYAGNGYHRFDETVEAALQLQTSIPYPVIDDNAADLRIYAPFEEVPGVSHFENLISSEEDLSCSGASCPDAGLRGKIDRALFFDGIDDVLSGPEFGIGTSTMAAWVKADGGTIFDTRKSNMRSGLYLDFNGFHIVMQKDNGQQGDLTEFYAVPFTLPENEWVHVAAVFDYSTETASVFVNGAFVGSVSTDVEESYSIAGEDPIIGSNRFNTNALHGYLDDIRLYSKALSQAEILNLITDSAPILRYEFDEEDDALTFEDLSVNGYIGYPTLNTYFDPTLGYTVTVPSPIPGTDGQIGNTALFDGNGRIEVSDASAVNSLTNEFAVMAWVNPDTVTGILRIAAASRENSNNGFSFAIMDGNLIFDVYGIVRYASTAAIQPNLWQHVAVVFDSGNDANFYVNGQLVDTVNGAAPVIPNADDPFFIGGTTAIGGSSLFQAFDGQIDELAIYGRELSDPEILSIYLRELRWYRESGSSLLIVDNDNPTIELLTDNLYRASGYTQLVVKTNDPTSHVTLLDVGIKAPGDSEFIWQGAVECSDSNRQGVAWCPVFDTSLLGGEGGYELQFRAVDVVGHETTSAVYNLYVDDTPPVASSGYSDSWISADLLSGFDDAWTMSLTGSVTDPPVGGVAGSGVLTQSVMVSLVDSRGNILDGEAQRATVSGSAWSIDYLSGGTRPFGTYNVIVSAADKMGNSTTITVGTILLDARPAQSDVNYWEMPGGIISETLVLSGTVSEQAFWGGVLARYHFEEPAGSTTFYDNHVEQEHATCVNCPTSTAALFGQGLLFDGVNDTVNVPNLFNPISDTFSISLWVNPSSVGPGGSLVQQRNGTGVGRSLLFLNANNQVRTNLGLGTTGGFGGVTLLTPGTWYHVAFTYDGTIAKIYVNGVLDGEGVIDGEAADGDLILGSNKTSANYFPGMMDEVVFYSTVLSDYAVHGLAQSNVWGAGDVNIGFELVDFAALTDTVTTTAALEANPIAWYTATVANPGSRLSTWSLTDNVALENYYTIKLRSDDAVGNQSSTGTIWRGLIDRVPPAVSASGQHIGGGAAAQTEYTFTFSDFLLDMESSSQPCQDASLVSLTYDDPIIPHDGQTYEVTATCRVPGHEVSRTFTACDSVGHCTDETVDLDPSPQVSSVAILTPTHNATITGTFLTIPVGGGAYDLDGIDSLAVQINGQPFDSISLIGETDTNWTAVNWQPTVSGTYTLTAIMTDTLNNVLTDSIQVFIEVDGVLVVGDTTCDTTRNVVDALYIMQYEVGARTAAFDCPLAPDTLFLPACDVNGDAVCNVVDALFIMQCEVGIANSLCPTVQPTESQVEGLTEEASGAGFGDNATVTAEPESGIRSSNRVTTIQINDSSLAVGETTVVPVWVNVPADSGLTAVTLDITFDPAIVAFNACTVNEVAFDLSLCALQEDGHTVSVTALSVSGFNGETFLVELSFTGLVAGNSHLEPSLRVFEDGSGQEARLRGGRLRVGQGGGKEISVLGKVVRTAVSTPMSQASDPNKGPDAVVPSTITIGSGVTAVGVPITVPITIDVPPTNDLMAATLRIQYDPTVLTFESCDANNDDFNFNLCNQSEGDGIPPDVVSFSAISAFGVNGSLELGTITFSGSSNGTSSLVIVAETYDDGSGEAPVTVDGTVEVEAPTAVSMGQMSTASLSTDQGSDLVLFLTLVMALLALSLLGFKRKVTNR